MSINTGDLRVDYQLDELLEDQVASNPFKQFEAWFKDANNSNVLEPNAMIIATVQPDGKPAARVVLLKEMTSEGFVFYTNYLSRKGQELANNPEAALVFNWLALQRQVRIEGHVEKIDADKATAYYHTRPKGSQIGAWASDQSQVIPDREVLENKKAELEATYADADKLPRPAHWGGYIVKPRLIEFWQGRSSRLHDRLQFELNNGEWQMVRLAP